MSTRIVTGREGLGPVARLRAYWRAIWSAAKLGAEIRDREGVSMTEAARLGADQHNRNVRES